MRELVQCVVSVERVDDVVHIVCGAFDVEVPDGISARSVLRIVLESCMVMLHQKMQLADHILNAQCTNFHFISLGYC